MAAFTEFKLPPQFFFFEEVQKGCLSINFYRPQQTVLGRKNYLFLGSHEGTQRSAMIYSFLGTCKMNDVNPKEWLADVLLRLPDTKTSELIGLLPPNWKKL